MSEPQQELTPQPAAVESEQDRLLKWAKQLANPVWCGSVPAEAKRVINQLVAVIEEAGKHETPGAVLDFINQRSEYVQATRGGAQGDNDGDYYRWQGHMEARRQLAESLGLTVPYEPGEKAQPKPAAGASR